MTKHTPGPWLTTVDTGACFHRGNRVSIYASGDDMCDATIAEVWPTPGEDGDVADGRLIAAAPDLLDALRELHAACEYWEDQEDPVLASARAAIAKAGGEGMTVGSANCPACDHDPKTLVHVLTCEHAIQVACPSCGTANDVGDYCTNEECACPECGFPGQKKVGYCADCGWSTDL